MLDEAPLPIRYDVNECVGMAVDPRTVFVYWEVRETTLEELRGVHPEGTLRLRAVVVEPSWEGPRTGVQDHDVVALVGDIFLADLPPGAVIRVAIGYAGSWGFAPIAHSSVVDSSPHAPLAPGNVPTLVRWTPAGSVRVDAADADAALVAQSVRSLRREAASARRKGAMSTAAPIVGSMADTTAARADSSDGLQVRAPVGT
jgi:hypothetical protein